MRRPRARAALAAGVTLLLCTGAVLLLWPARGRDGAGQGAPPAPAGLPGCVRYGVPRAVGRVPAVLSELSGLAASARHPGVYWGHNDSGHAPELVALQADGTVRARLRLRGPWRPRDLEDVGLGPCGPDAAAGSCLYVADTGNNFRLRAVLAVLRVREPEVLADADVDAEPLRFRLAEGRRDVEALLVHPRTGELGLVTKEGGRLGTLLVLEGLGPVREGVARPVRVLDVPGRLATAASVHPSGERALLRSYEAAWELRAPGARSLAQLLAAPLVEVPSARQRQAEAVAYTTDGQGYLLGSEFTGEPLMWVPCDAASR